MTMPTASLTADTSWRYEDALAHLPASRTTEYRKGQLIYDLANSPRSIYLVVKGTVGISHTAADGTEVLLDIVPADELFGESAFLEVSGRSERATAIEDAELMTWAVSDMEDLVTKRPRLAVALLQVLAQRNADFARRIESFATDGVQRRLARALILFSERLRTQEENGSVWMMPLTHDTLSKYIGTSREIVSQYMNQFRKQGYITYSRRGISLRRDTLRTVLD